MADEQSPIGSGTPLPRPSMVRTSVERQPAGTGPETARDRARPVHPGSSTTPRDEIPTASPRRSAPTGLPAVWDYAVPRPPSGRRTRWLTRYTAAVATADLSAAVLALAVAQIVPFEGSITGWTVLFPVAWVACLVLGRVYEHRFVGNGTEEYRRLFNSAVRFLAVVSSIGYAASLAAPRRLVIALPLAIMLSLAAHYAARQVLHALRRRDRCMERVVIVGRERSVSELIRTVRLEPQAGFSVVAACVDRCASSEIEGVPVLGDSASVLRVLDAVSGDAVMITAWSDVSQTDLRRLSWDL
jgi:hypothetical protein